MKTFSYLINNYLMGGVIFLFFLIPPAVYSQSGFTLSWNSEVGCFEYGLDGKRLPFEEIGESDCLLTCQESSITFTVEYENQDIASIDWSTNGGVINTISNDETEAVIAWPELTYTGSVSVDVTLANGMVHTTTICVSVKSLPEANFKILGEQSDQFCTHSELHFNNLSEAEDGLQIIAVVWDFGDGTTSGEFNPTHTYTEEGTYVVKLTVYDECNCKNTKSKTIYFQKPGFEFSCPTVVCESDMARYTIEWIADPGQGTPCANYNWYVDGGQVLDQGNDWIDVLWDSPIDDGFGYVYFDQSQCNLGCDNFLVAKVPVIPTVGIIQGGKTELCQGEQSRYTLPKWPTTTFKWKIFGAGGADVSNAENTVMVDQPNEVVVDAEFLQPGSYKLVAYYQNTLLSCGGKAEFQFTVKELLEVDEENSDDEICVNNTAHFYVNYSSSTVTWTILQNDQVYDSTTGTGQDGHGTYVFDEPGHYTVMAEANGYCKAYWQIKVVDVPDIGNAYISGAEEVCPGIGEVYTFNGDSDDFNVYWEVDHGTFMGPNVGTSVTIKFEPNYTDYQVSAYLVNPELENCTSDTITFNVTRFEPDAEIVQTTGDPEAICASSVESFELDGYPDAEYYEWKITPAELANVASGQGTENADILFNEPFMGQTQGTISVSAKVCGTVQVIDQVNFELMPAPGFAITAAPVEICPNTPFDVEVTITGGPNIPQSSFTIVFDGISGSMPGANLITQGVYKFQNIELPNVNPNDDVNISYTITVDDPLLCEPITATGTILLKPAPEIQIWIADGSQVFCQQSMIDTELSANIQGIGVSANNIEWIYMGNVVGTGTTFYPSNFGIYTARATNSANCTSYSNSISIIQDCSNNGDTPCQNETAVFGAEWTDCDILTLTATYSGNPVETSFIKLGSFTTINAVGQTPSTTGSTLTQDFEIKSSGSYVFAFRAEYSNCVLNTQPVWVDVDYQPIMYLDVSCDDNAYEVSILNESTYIDGTSHNVSYTFIKEPSQVITPSYQDDDYATATLTDGDYILGLTLTASGKPTCEVTENLPLQLPNAYFEFEANPVCVENTVNLQPEYPQPEGTYLWEFQLASNTLQNITPNLNLPEIGNIVPIQLTITDKYGCTDTFSDTIVVNKAEFEIELTATPKTDLCEGEEADLGYILISTENSPVGFQWNHNLEPIAGATNGTLLDVNVPGEYSLHLYDANGCADLTASSIFINQISSPYLAAKITPAACKGDDIVLTGTISPADAMYQISRQLNNDPVVVVQPFTAGPVIDFTDIQPDVGDYVYEVIVIDLITGCSYSEIFNSVVYPVPEVSIAIAEFECKSHESPYEVTIKAGSNMPGGTYTWSNGDSGESIVVDHGGAYQVTYQPYGVQCYATATIEIPKSPEEYTWIFPTGCFEYCEDMLNEPYITGPIGPVPEDLENIDSGYLYNLNDQIVAGDDGLYPIADLIVPPMEGALNFMLWNELGCKTTTNDLNLTMEECKDCGMNIMTVLGIKEAHGEYEIFYQIVFNEIINPFNMDITVVLSSLDGVFNPSGIFIPANGSYNFENYPPIDFIPNSNNIQEINIQVEVYGNDGHGPFILCTETVIIRIGDYIQNKNMEPKMFTMDVFPNPAKSHVEIQYEIVNTDEFKGGILNLYSLSGTLISSQKVSDTQGRKTFDTESLASGAYIVVFIYDGMRMDRQILIKQ